MGRREKKDRGDPVETAKREYIEETLDFGSLSQHLDTTIFQEPNEDCGQGDGSCPKSFAMYFKPASMVVIFCEVPLVAVEHGEVPPAKKQKTSDKPEPLTYNPGRTGHLKCLWVDAEMLRTVFKSRERLPQLHINGKDYNFFPMTASIFRMVDAREWLDPPTQAISESKCSTDVF